MPLVTLSVLMGMSVWQWFTEMCECSSSGRPGHPPVGAVVGAGDDVLHHQLRLPQPLLQLSQLEVGCVRAWVKTGRKFELLFCNSLWFFSFHFCIYVYSYFCVLCFPCMNVSAFSFRVWKPRGSSKFCHACITTIKDLKNVEPPCRDALWKSIQWGETLIYFSLW